MHRNKRRLEEVTKECELKGARVEAAIIDIKDSKKLTSWIEKIPEIDLIIANAGISAGTGGGGENITQVRNIFDTNIYGVIDTIHPAINNMKEHKKGQIVIISSLSAYRGLPSSPAYSASKAAVKIYGEALRGVLQADNIKLTVVTPGYIKTPMTDANNFYMPFLIDANKAVSIIIRKLKKNPARIAFPAPLYFIVWFLTILSPALTDPLFSRLPKKNSQ